ncbi:helix-turn-helix domain-containing protein [Arthrobacter sp. EPSL27]|uniref:helix-turn-helix domain-containing protein n=1 Tax=Arthrobacter sp. EPSL27 TaxID=1745378 RepID=UPI003FA48557
MGTARMPADALARTSERPTTIPTKQTVGADLSASALFCCCPAAVRSVSRSGSSPVLKGKGISASDIGKMLGVSRATVYRYLL